jgi:high-affinity Fe2+/Pb2+ permease
MKRNNHRTKGAAWCASDSRILSMVAAPVVAFLLVAVSMQSTMSGLIFPVCISLAMLVAAVGLVSGVWFVFDRFSVMRMSFGLFFSVINLLAINGLIGLLQR